MSPEFKVTSVKMSKVITGLKHYQSPRESRTAPLHRATSTRAPQTGPLSPGPTLLSVDEWPKSSYVNLMFDLIERKHKFNKWVKYDIIKTKLTIFMNKTRIPHTSRFDISRNDFSHKNDNFVIALILQMTCKFPRVFKAIYHDEWWITPCFYISIDSFYQLFFFINLKDLPLPFNHISKIEQVFVAIRSQWWAVETNHFIINWSCLEWKEIHVHVTDC